MPTTEELLASLKEIANQQLAVAITWHFVALVGITALALGWHPKRRTAGLLLALPLVSVSVLAWAAHNGFNGTVFAVLALLLGFVALREPDTRCIPKMWLRYAGFPVLVFGLVYPHFVEVSSPAAYLYAAPVGLIPCPTLAMVIGFTLLLGPPGRAYGWILAVAGLFYGVFGVLRLGVWLDLGLIIGASLLALAVIARDAAAARSPVQPSDAPA